MKKTFIALLALAGVAAAENYSYEGSTDDWAEEAENWHDGQSNLLGSSGFLSDSDNSGKVSGSTFTIGNGKSAKAGGHTGGFNGATINIEEGGTLKVDHNNAIGANATVNVSGNLVVNSNKVLGPATVKVSGTGAMNVNGHIGAANITLDKGATFTTDGDLKLNGTTFTLEETLNLGNVWLDGNANTGNATFNLGESGIVAFGTLSYRVGANDTARWTGTYTLSANSNEGYGYTLSDDEVGLFTRTLMTFADFTANSGDLSTLLEQIEGGEITLLDGTMMTQREGNAAFDGTALTGADVGQYRFVIEDMIEGKALKVQYAAYLVPEPTTATLSLLALAGLAARRRRR